MADDNRVTDNVTLWDNNGDKEVSIITDGLVERLAVYSKITTDAVYRIQTVFSNTDINFPSNDNWIELVNIIVAGRAHTFLAEFFDSNYDMRFTVDGEVVLEINNQELGQVNLKQGSAVQDIRGSIYRYNPSSVVWHFPQHTVFDSSFKIEVKRRSGNNHGLDNYFFQWEKLL